MSAKRPRLRTLFKRTERLPRLYFYTSNLSKFLHARVVFDKSGLLLNHFRSQTDPYEEDYEAGRESLLIRALKQVTDTIGGSSFVFVEDTSVRIECLSDKRDFPGLAIKEWFQATSFDEADAILRSHGNDRRASVFSHIALRIPSLGRPLFFSGETQGTIAETPPEFSENLTYPWLTPTTFNGWIIPNGTTTRLGEMSLEESWRFDFRTQALESLIDRVEELTASLNAPPTSFARATPSPSPKSPQQDLFNQESTGAAPRETQVIVVVGKTCAGKTTFGDNASNLGWTAVDASQVMRTFRDEFDPSEENDFEFAARLLREKGSDVVARRVLDYYSESDRLVISGFRAIEELLYVRSKIEDTKIVLIDASERTRFERLLKRPRGESPTNIEDLRETDSRQYSLGLLRVAEDFADRQIENEGTLEEYSRQVEALLDDDTRRARGVFDHGKLRHGPTENQLYRCLVALSGASRPLSCDEIEELTSQTGNAIRHNNANKVLKAVPELARRIDPDDDRVRYEILNAGRAYIRLMDERSKPQ